jgi:hypothetical protein
MVGTAAASFNHGVIKMNNSRTIMGSIKRQTNSALLISVTAKNGSDFGEMVDVWFPISQILCVLDLSGEIEVKDWIFQQKSNELASKVDGFCGILESGEIN